MEKNIHESAIIEAGAAISDSSSVWHHAHIMADAVVESGCTIGKNVFIANRVRITEGTKIQNNVSVYEGVTIGQHVFLGPSSVFTNVINPRSEINRKKEYLKTSIGSGATIGANATVLCGVMIGKYAMVGAGSVVITEVKDYEIHVGNPSKLVGWISEAGSRLLFDPDGFATCSIDSSRYRMLNQRIEKILE